MRITQALVAPTLGFFKKGFLECNNLVDYYNENEPAIFFGARDSSNIINNHKSYKIIYPAYPHDYPLLDNYDNTFFICPNLYNLPDGVIRKDISPKTKNYDLFQPSIMGDKIYTYSGFKDGWNHRYDIVKEIQKKINFEIITTEHSVINDYYDIQFLKTNYYDKCFLNLNFSNGHGMTTIKEFGFMGRKTIMNENYYKFPCVVGYKDIDDIINIINEESKKIGTIQPSINSHNVDDDWLDIDFWIKNN